LLFTYLGIFAGIFCMKYFNIFIFSIFISGCREQNSTISPAFYHWKTALQISPYEQSALDSLGCNTLYVKFLDIARDPDQGNIRPYSVLEIADTLGLQGRSIIPVIFVANNVFDGISTEKINWLCDKIVGSLRANSQRLPISCLPFREVQFDCDWTSSTRSAFFSFLKQIRLKLPAATRLSATIRLHQYKFPSATGIPPVDRGILMLYNTGDVDDTSETNSIFEAAAARKYLTGAPARYPLPLDLALPLFSWGLVFREEAFWKIIPDITQEALSDTTCFQLEWEAKRTWYSIKKGTFLGGHYLRPGYRIRLEGIGIEQLRSAAAVSAAVALAPDARIAFYHLDSAIVRRFSARELAAILSIYRVR